MRVCSPLVPRVPNGGAKRCLAAPALSLPPYLPRRASHHHLGRVLAERDLLHAQARVIAVGIKAAHLREGTAEGTAQTPHTAVGQPPLHPHIPPPAVAHGPLWASCPGKVCPHASPALSPMLGQTRGTGPTEQASLVSPQCVTQQLCPEPGDTSPGRSRDGSGRCVPRARLWVCPLGCWQSQEGAEVHPSVPHPGDLTLRKGGHSSSPAWLRLSLCSQSVWKMLAVPSL